METIELQIDVIDIIADRIAENVLAKLKTEEQGPVLDKVRTEIMDAGAYEQETNGKTEFLKGIDYCLNILEKYKAEHDGCEGCAFMDVEEWEMPCCKCKHGCKDYWRANDADGD